MNRLFLLLLLSFSIALQNPLIAQNEAEYIPNEWIIKLAPEQSPQALCETLDRLGTVSGRFYIKRTLSSWLDIYLLAAEGGAHGQEKRVLAELERLPAVQLAQLNHVVQHRSTVPNDSSFLHQWSLDNTGQNGGLVDADIDAPEAWDITTGGNTVFGDTIVVAVIDGGVELDHPDLNLWKNYGEIPNNGIDDDLNGYIDDFDGWNAYNDNGILFSDLHGTHVAGIIGARGNNGTGVSGVNWNVQIMPISGSSQSEAVVVAAYSYALEMRLLHRYTNGKKGAYVVATNSSFGVDFGHPDNFPIWCMMYDSLGSAGILNAGATMNLGVNVDSVGDVPSSCSSEYLIAVTNTTRRDTLNPGAAFGASSIDMGAPGTDILSTGLDSLYAGLTGTSMATPHVAGVISLIYAAACPSLIAEYENHPALVSQWVKQLILDGGDALADLQGRTLSGKRLNAHQSLLLIDSLCNTLSPCFSPFGFEATNVLDTSVVMTWTAPDSAAAFFVEYRALGDTVWIQDTVSSASIALGGLSACSLYEIRVAAVCGMDTTAYSAVFSFVTEGCCEPPVGLQVDSLMETRLQLSWDNVFGADSFLVVYQLLGEPWDTLVSHTNTWQFEGLMPCSRYYFRVEAMCDSLMSGYAYEIDARTSGCGFCGEGDYCESLANNMTAEWIEAIRIGTVENASGNDGGYGDYTGLPDTLVANVVYPIRLEPGFGSSAFHESWRIWIDLNQDAVFDSIEMIYETPVSMDSVIDTSFVLTTPIVGTTRMRVSMKFGTRPEACNPFSFGEVEDYCVTIVSDSNLCLPPTLLSVSDIGETFAELMWEGEGPFLIRYHGTVVSQWTYDTTSSPMAIVSNLLGCEEYTFEVARLCGEDTTEFTALDFTTKGCGACLDLDYCGARGTNTQNEWIQRATFIEDSLNVQQDIISGDDGGYGDYTTETFSGVFITIVQSNEGQVPFAIRFTPGFTNQATEETWRVWLDWDEDGVFEPHELLADTVSLDSSSILIPIILPIDSISETFTQARLRVAMKWDIPADSCEVFTFGEVEDYCVGVNWVSSIEEALNLPRVALYPNPSTGELHIASEEEYMSGVEVWDVLGKQVFHREMRPSPKTQLDLTHLPNGIYQIRIRTMEHLVSKKWVKH